MTDSSGDVLVQVMVAMGTTPVSQTFRADSWPSLKDVP